MDTRLKLFDLSGRRALITGSSKGIGFAMAEALASAGAAIVLNARGAGRLDEARSRLAAGGHEVSAAAFDVTDPDAVAAGVDAIERDLGAIDILVNNAGVQHRAPLHEFPRDAWSRLVSTNLDSVFFVGQAVARHMIGRGRGKIINICSVQSELARPGIAPYTATNWGRLGLQVNGIGPGYFRTELNQALVDDAAFSGWLANRTPMGRWGEVGELAGAAIFLASDASSFINGHILYVDGGITSSL